LTQPSDDAGFPRARGALLVLALLAAAYLALAAGGWRVHAFVTGNTDLGAYFIPKYQYAADRIAAGELPEWNPYEFGGIPFLATIQPAVFYPPLRAAYALASGETAYLLLFFAHLVVAALGTMLLARALGLGLWPAALAAAWVTQPTWIVRLYDHPVYLTATTWIPYLLLLSRRVVLTPSARGAALLGLVAALQATSGYPPLVLATAYVLLLGLPFWLVEGRRTRAPGDVGRAALALAGAGAVAGLLAAVQLVPTAALARLTNRAAEAEEWHARLTEMARMPSNMLFLIGAPQFTLAGTARELWTRFGPVLLATGLAALLLRPRRITTWFALAFTVLAAGLPFGVYQALPLYGFVRFALEWSFIAPLAVYLLAAVGLDAALARFATLRRHAAPVTIALLALATGLNWRLVDARWLGFDLGTPPPMPPVEHLCDYDDPRYRTFWTIGQMRGALMAARVRSPSGYEQSLLPARSAEVQRALGIGNGAVQPYWARSLSQSVPAASRMALRCVLTPRAPVLALGGLVEQPYAGEHFAWAYVNPKALPRARLEHRVLPAASPDEARALFLSSEPEGVVLEGAPGVAGDAAAAGCDDPAKDRVEIVRDEPEEVAIRVASACPGYLVLADTLVPGWSATLEDEPVEILAADYVFRAVRVPAGEQRVVFRYRAPGLRLGAALSLAGVVLLVVLLTRRPRPRTRGPEPAAPA